MRHALADRAHDDREAVRGDQLVDGRLVRAAGHVHQTVGLDREGVRRVLAATIVRAHRYHDGVAPRLAVELLDLVAVLQLRAGAFAVGIMSLVGLDLLQRKHDVFKLQLQRLGFRRVLHGWLPRYRSWCKWDAYITRRWQAALPGRSVPAKLP